MNKKWVILAVIATLAVAFLVWLFIASSKSLPGTKIVDLGRGHVPVGTKVDYNSNPPTSGKHYEEWIKAGVYDEAKDDRNLVHSLEHGYIIMSYNCSFGSQTNQKEPSRSAEATSSGKVSEECQKLIEQLKFIFEKKGKHKLIVIPRPNLDSKIALTAWNYLDKFNDFDEKRIEVFIDAHRDQGPEQTMEP